MKKIALYLPDDAIAGNVTLVKFQDGRVMGLELLTRNFDFQPHGDTELYFTKEMEDNL